MVSFSPASWFGLDFRSRSNKVIAFIIGLAVVIVVLEIVDIFVDQIAREILADDSINIPFAVSDFVTYLEQIWPPIKEITTF